MPTTPRIMSGFMELLPDEQNKFDAMKAKISQTFTKNGFNSIDTPTLELSEVLLAKAGGETEKQIYRFSKGDNDVTMRFDLTVPLSRYCAEYFGNLTFPFKVCHIAKSFRGERPQKGRFREFYQCDADIVGFENLPLFYDAEIIALISQVYKNLDLPVKILINFSNRKLIAGILEHLGQQNNNIDILRIIDKLDKMGEDKVKEELCNLGLSSMETNRLFDFISQKGAPEAILAKLNNLKIDNETFLAGLAEMQEVITYLKAMNIPEEELCFNLSLTRGLDYYTGTVYETKIIGYAEFGSVGGGGRYENLASNFTKQKLPGVGVSFGLTRLFSLLRENNLLPKQDQSNSVCVLGFEDTLFNCFEIANKLRDANFNVEVMPTSKSFKWRMERANKLGSKYAIVIGADEMATSSANVKNMQTGEQSNIKQAELVDFLNQN